MNEAFSKYNTIVINTESGCMCNKNNNQKQHQKKTKKKKAELT